MAGANNGPRRLRPNLLITGTPGTGKSTTASALAEATNFRHICVGDLVKEKNLHDGWDDQFECHIINEDLVSCFVHHLSASSSNSNSLPNRIVVKKGCLCLICWLRFKLFPKVCVFFFNFN